MEKRPLIEAIQMSAHLPIDIMPVIGRKWVTNGIDGSNFNMIKDAYDDSTTNSAIINAFTNYIYADGLVDTAGEYKINEKGEVIIDKRKTNINKHISKSDIRLICNDYKQYGGYAIQVIWNSAFKMEDKKPLLIKYLPIYKLGLNIDVDMNVDGYWMSFSWKEKTKYKPTLYPKYTGKYKGNDVEILMVQRPSSNTFFAQPDYISSIRWAQIEGLLSTASYNHINNGFSPTKLVNVNSGIPATEELRREYTRSIERNFTGPEKQGSVLVSFNKSKELAMTIENIDIPELNAQFVWFSQEAERKLIVGHSAPPILFAGTNEGGGLGNNSEELKTATQMLYRKTINPMREAILDGIIPIMNYINPAIKMAFLDFEEFDNATESDKITK